MNLFIILWNRLDVWVPSVFSSDLLNSFLLILLIQTLESSCKSVVSLLGETSLTSLSIISSSSWRFCQFVPFKMRCTQKWNRISKLLSSVNFFMIFPFVWNISIKDKRSSVNRSLKSTLSRSHGRAILRFVLNTHCLNSFSCYWFTWGILSEKLWICHGWIVKCNGKINQVYM